MIRRNHLIALSLAATSLATVLPAQSFGSFLFTTTQTETTISGSGGTVLQTIQPNEIAYLERCPAITEKWAPRTCFHTMAGDVDGDDAYWDPGMFGRIDALLDVGTPIGFSTQRMVYWSPSQPMGTAVSGAPGLRPGDVGRIVRNTLGDGQVQHFVTQDQIVAALGLPAGTPINVDACALDFTNGVYLSLEDDITVNLCVGGTFLLRDGDVFMLPVPDTVIGSDLTVWSVVFGSAIRVFTENQMDAAVVNAQVTNRNGICQTQIFDVDALEIDVFGGFAGSVTACSGVSVNVRHVAFAGRTLTGGAILTTAGGGAILNNGCVPLGTSCGSGPTMGPQVGLQPTSTVQGMASSINGLARAQVCRFVSETPTPVTINPTTVDVHFAVPAPFVFVIASFAAPGPGVVTTSFTFPPGFLCFPDYYNPVISLGLIPVTGGFATYTSPTISFSVDLIFQGAALTTFGNFEVSTPTTVEVQ